MENIRWYRARWFWGSVIGISLLVLFLVYFFGRINSDTSGIISIIHKAVGLATGGILTFILGTEYLNPLLNIDLERTYTNIHLVAIGLLLFKTLERSEIKFAYLSPLLLLLLMGNLAALAIFGLF